MSIDYRRNYYMVVDTETCGELEAPLTYDIGFLVVDSKGNIYERRSYIVPEIFYGEADLMNTAYYHEKLPQYYKGALNGNEWEIKPFFAIRREMLQMAEDYRVKAFCAYNAPFDFYRALNNTMRHLLKKEKAYFFPYGTQFFDIWHMACASILCRKGYDKMAYENEWVSEKGNVRTNAEKAFAYLSGNTEYEERHTALADCEIEAQILVKCLPLCKDNREIVYNPWRIPQPPFKEYVAKKEGRA